MTKILLAFLVSALAVLALAGNVEISQERLNSLIDSDEAAAIKYLESLYERCETPEDRVQVCQLIKEKIWDKFPSEEEKEDSPLFKCYDDEVDARGPKARGIPTIKKPDPRDIWKPDTPEKPERTGEKGEHPEEPERSGEAGDAPSEPEGPEGTSEEAPEAPTRDEEENEAPTRDGTGENVDEPHDEPDVPETPTVETTVPDEPEEPEVETEEPSAPEVPTNENTEPDVPDVPEQVITAPTLLIETYKANFYKNYESLDTDCFRDSIDDVKKLNSGLMATLYDICIVEEDGFLYLVFYPTVYSGGYQVLVLGEDSVSYNVGYDTTEEDFTISEGIFDGTNYKHTNSHIVELRFLMSVYEQYLSGSAQPYPIQAKWLAYIDETYTVCLNVNLKSFECFTPTQGRLSGIELCVKYPKAKLAQVYANGVLVKETTDITGSKIEVEYLTQDDAVKLYSETGVLKFVVISSEILYVVGAGTIGVRASLPSFSASLEYDPDGPVAQYDCINVYNEDSEDYVLYSEVNILCLYCDTVEDEPVECGIGLYSKEKEQSSYTTFGEIDRKLTLIYETSTETIHVLYGDEELSFYADELFYFIISIQEQSLQPMFDSIPSSYLTRTVSTADCQASSLEVCTMSLAGWSLSLTCVNDGCYIGKLSGSTFLGSKLYGGDWVQAQTYAVEDADMADTYEYCLSLESADGEYLNHCLMDDQVQMYVETLTKYPVYTLST